MSTIAHSLACRVLFSGAMLMVLMGSAFFGSGCDRSPAGSTSSAPPTTPTTGPTANAGNDAGAPSGVVRIVAINAPLACFATRIGGDRVVVSMPVPAGVDPAFWSPAAEEIVAMQAADLIILNGAGHEPWRARTSLPERKVLETANRFRSSWIEIDDGVTHSHGLAGAHSHKGTACTTWLDPTLASEQVQAIFEALAAARPEDREEFAVRAAALKTELEDIDRQWEAAIQGQQALPVFFSHPVYQYLARRFALNGRSVHWEPDEMPGEEEWTALEHLRVEHPAQWMIWEDDPAPAIRDRLRGMGIECVVVRPAGNPGGDPRNWIGVQRENASSLAKAYE